MSSQDLEPGDVLDDFEISSVLARSGMGSVFRAKQRSTGRDVVLKVPHLHFESDVAFYSRFLREERIGLRLDHDAIVKVIPNAKRSRQYLVMEYVEGPSLWRMMKAQGRIPVELALDIGRQVCEALAYMHRAGVVHRDLKPENIVIDSSDRAHIIDFGIALDFSDRRITWGRLSSRLGTPEYMAPEQIRGKRGDGRVDVYALGIILYEMLSGRSAYVAESPALLVKAKSKRDARPLSDVAPDVDPRIEALITRAIARDPKDRYANADAMLDALRDPSRALEEYAATPPGERPPGFWPRLVASLARTR